MKRVNVYDRVNQDRLLGSMPRWASPEGHTHRRFAAADPGPIGPICCDGYSPEADMYITIVTLEKVVKTSKNGGESEVIAVTDAPLSDLVKLDGFRPAFDYCSYDCDPGFPRAY